MTELAYHVTIADPLGVKLAELDRFIILEYTRSVRDVGALKLGVSPTIDRSIFRLDGRIQVWRRPAGGADQLETETVWLIRDTEPSLDENGRHLVFTAYSANELLARRIVAYAAGSAQASKSAPADDVMKAIVRENLGASAGTGRAWSALLSIAADLGQGPSISKAFSRRNVLEVLREISEDAAKAGTPVYYDIVAPTPETLEFRTYKTLRGVDHTLSSGNPVVMSPERGTLKTVGLTMAHSQEVNFVYAGGAGEKASRLVATAQDDTRIGQSPFNRREAFVDAQAETLAALQAEANTALRDGRPRRTFMSTIQDAEQCRYGVHWRWGDRVTAQYDGESFDCDVAAIHVAVRDGRETISAQLKAEDGL